MPSNELKLLTLCAYLTDTDVDWRREDYDTNKMVKALKGTPINGYFTVEIAGMPRRIRQTNVHEFLDRVPKAMAKHIALHLPENATLVPIPNSHVIDPTTPNFRTLDLAQAIAKESGGNLVAVPALVFREAQVKSHEGGPRSAHHFEAAYKVTKKVDGPIVLVDDVCTGGGHLIGAAWKLGGMNQDVALACTFGRSTKAQQQNPLGVRIETLDLRRVTF
jgi:hypothetical protein